MKLCCCCISYKCSCSYRDQSSCCRCRRSQHYHPHEAHLAAIQQASSLCTHSHFSQKGSAAGKLQLLSITTGLLSKSLLNFLPQHLVCKPVWRPDREILGRDSRHDTHVHGFLCTHTHSYKNTVASCTRSAP